MKSHDDRICIIDASPSGVSGDKYLGALIDLGGDPQRLKEVAKAVADNLPGAKSIDVRVRKVERGDVGSQLVTIESSEEVDRRKATVLLASAKKCLSKLGLSESATSFTLSTIETLQEAEAKVHGHTKSDIELKELGSADTLVDILGVASLVESLGLQNAQWWWSPVAVGGGVTQFSNRSYPNPPPAVAEILRSHHFPTERGPSNVELSTPTGVAITVNLVTNHSRSYPQFSPESVGYGAGSKELLDVANVLRLTVGRVIGGSHAHDEMVILETNVDDVSGEVIGRAMERLMQAGAKDVTVGPIYMKKNRPGHIITVIARKNDAEKLADVLISETGTFGVRELPVIRHISPRESTEIRVKIKGREYSASVKLSKNRSGRLLRAKLEYEDLRRISEKTGLSLREVEKLAKPKLDSLKG